MISVQDGLPICSMQVGFEKYSDLILFADECGLYYIGYCCGLPNGDTLFKGVKLESLAIQIIDGTCSEPEWVDNVVEWKILG